VNEWAVVFLGVIAVATLATAIVQVGVLVAAGRLARRIERLADQVERELKPVFEHLNAIGRDASRAAALATAQVERADRVFADLANRLERTLDSLQDLAGRPARQGAAFVTAVRAMFAVIRDLRSGRARSRADEEDTLFI
jgi:ornithine cyclodeaminase/alanine dehydrogenase-like protein (mu-crystallin family)